ncbi:MAG TPA: mycothiol synthase [Acidimicrobiales bacterium]|nr:mycothiol synthase [Acidimicrobiales bacterium]
MPTAPVPLVHVDVTSSLEPAVRDQIRVLLHASEQADGYPALSDEALLAFGEGAPAGTVSLLARVADRVADRDDGALAGFGLLGDRDGAWNLETVVRPQLRDDAVDVLGALLDTALAEIAARGGGRVRAWLRTEAARDAEELRARGLRPERELLQLRAPLPPEAVHDASAPPVPVRPFHPGRDEEAWLAVNARAFAGHPEQGSWTREDLERREREPWFDQGGFLLHEVGGRLAAFCWTKVHRSPVLGEIYVIGVDPDFQGRGLGRALTRAGLGHLATRAVPTAMLYVEATNTPAQVLYRSLGFTEHHREVQFRGDVPAARQVDAPTARPIP